jgi:hypothetical protein
MVLTLYNSAKKTSFFFFFSLLSTRIRTFSIKSLILLWSSTSNDMNFKCRHANSHFEVEDEQLAKDLEFAQQLAFAPSSPPSMVSILSPLPFFFFFIALPIQIRKKWYQKVICL